MTTPTCDHPTPKGNTTDTRCPLCAPTQYQCQQSTCLKWQDAAPHCRHCQAPLTGQRSGRQYTWDGQPLHIRERLGSGGMGEVYRGYTQTTPPQYVAVKFNKEIEQAERFARFKREVGHLTKLQSPHSVIVYGYGEQSEGGVLQAQFMVMELLHGVELSQHLTRGPLPPADVLALSQQLLEALTEIHAQGVIHRDLKPDNIMLIDLPVDLPVDLPIDASGPPYTAKLFDFGLAKDLNLAAPGVSASGIVLGTPWYMAPEQARCEPVDQRSDLFSLGIIIYEMLTGTRPYPANNLYELFQLHIQPPPPIPTQLPHPLPALLQGTLAHAPADRFPTAKACLDLLTSTSTSAGYGYFRPSPLPSHAAPLPSQDALLAAAEADELTPPLPSWLLGLLLLFVLGSGSMAYFFFDRAKGTSSSSTKKPTRTPTLPVAGKQPKQRDLQKQPKPRSRPAARATLPAPARKRPLFPVNKRSAPEPTKRPKQRTRTLVRPKRPTLPRVTLLLQPPCARLRLLLPNRPALLLEKPTLTRKPGRYRLRCQSPKRRLDRTFFVKVKARPKRQIIKRRWSPIQVKLMIPRWAYPYADGFLIPRCQIGCIIQLWSGTTKIVLKRPIQGIKRRVTVHTQGLKLAPDLQNAPLGKRTFTIRWEPQKTQKGPKQKK